MFSIHDYALQVLQLEGYSEWMAKTTGKGWLRDGSLLETNTLSHEAPLLFSWKPYRWQNTSWDRESQMVMNKREILSIKKRLFNNHHQITWLLTVNKMIECQQHNPLERRVLGLVWYGFTPERCSIRVKWQGKKRGGFDGQMNALWFLFKC